MLFYCVLFSLHICVIVLFGAVLRAPLHPQGCK